MTDDWTPADPPPEVPPGSDYEDPTPVDPTPGAEDEDVATPRDGDLGDVGAK